MAEGGINGVIDFSKGDSYDLHAFDTVKGGDYPASLKASQEAGVVLLEENAAPEGKESLFSDVNNMSELGVGATDLEKQRIIDAAIGNTDETFEEIMADFNARWADAIKEVSGN